MPSKAITKPTPPAEPLAPKTAVYVLRLWEIVEIYRAIASAGPIKSPKPIIGYRIALNRNLLKPFIETYDEQVRVLQEKFTRKDPDTGRMAKKKRMIDGVEVELNEWDIEDMDGWNQANVELNNETHEITFHTLKLADFGTAQIEQQLMNALVYMIAE